MKPLIKICGISSLEAAQTAEQAGATFIGLNFIPIARHFISTEKAQEIVAGFGPTKKVRVVGVFQNQSLKEIEEIITTVPLDMVQLHGEESPEFCNRISVPIIKALALASEFDVQETQKLMSSYQVEMYLLDRLKQGEGKVLDWFRVKKLAEEFPLLLAGGLNPENIHAALTAARPLGADVASGIETEGLEDLDKIKRFIQLAQTAIV